MSTITTTDLSADERRALDQVRERLEARFPDAGSAAVGAAIADAHRRFDGGTIRDFVPLFVERDATSRLENATTR